MNGLISIIIPIYNSEKYLDNCLKSILNQTYKNFEVLCVDDGSSDRSVEIINQYVLRDKRVIFYKNRTKGVSAARNYALEKCKGEYVLFVDSDDWIDLDICYEAFKVAKMENADIVLWSYIREYPDQSKPRYILGNQKKIFRKEDMNYLCRRLYGLIGKELSQPEDANTIVTAWGKLYKKEKIGDLKFVDLKEIGTSEDTLFNMEVFQKCEKAVYIPKCSYHYRKNNVDSVTTRYNPKLYKQWENLYNIIEKKIYSLENPAICLEAFYNRIALGLIPYVLNVVVSKNGLKKQYREVKAVLVNKRYQKAFDSLQIKYMPIYWRLFFIFAKVKFSIGVLLLGEVMQFMRRR